MKAILLNSGIGKRMHALTTDKPKCLVPLSSSETIMDRQIRILGNNGITDLIITTGPFAELIEERIKKNYSDFNVKYVHNPQFNSTNYIYSLHLIPPGFLDDDILLLHGDLVFDEILFNLFLSSSSSNSVLVNKMVPQPKKDFKGRIESELVTEIGVDIFDDNCYALMPLYKLSLSFFKQWKQEIDRFIVQNKVQVYAENAFNTISDQLELFPYYYTDELCMEIDTESDLVEVQTHLKKL